MQIKFIPIRRDTPLMASILGDALTLNDETFDFAGIPEGATLPRSAVACDWLGSDVERIDGQIHLTLLLPYGVNAPEETRRPQPVEVMDGPVSLPPHDTTNEEEPQP